MAEREYYKDSMGRRTSRERTSAEDVASAGLENLSDDFKPPKQNPGEGPGDYGRRVAAAREAHRQRKAMR